MASLLVSLPNERDLLRRSLRANRASSSSTLDPRRAARTLLYQSETKIKPIDAMSWRRISLTGEPTMESQRDTAQYWITLLVPPVVFKSAKSFQT